MWQRRVYYFRNQLAEHFLVNKTNYFILLLFTLFGIVTAMINVVSVVHIEYANFKVLDATFIKITVLNYSLFGSLFYRALTSVLVLGILCVLAHTKRFYILIFLVPFYFSYLATFTICYLIILFGLMGVITAMCCLAIWLLLLIKFLFFCALFLNHNKQYRFYGRSAEFNLKTFCIYIGFVFIAVCAIILLESILHLLLLNSLMF